MFLRQNAAARFTTAADQEPARGYDVPRPRDDRLHPPVAVEQRDGFRQRFGQHHIAEQRLRDRLEAGPDRHVLQQQHRRVRGRAGRARGVVQCDRRNEPAAPGIVALQVVDGGRARLLRLDDDVLKRFAERRLHGDGSRRLGLEHVGHQGDDPLQLGITGGCARAHVLHHGLDPVLVPFEVVLHLFQGGELRTDRRALELERLGLLDRGAERLGPLVQTRARLGDAPPEGLDFRLNRLQARVGPPLPLLGLGDTLLGLGLLLVRPPQPALEALAVVGRVLVHVAVLGLSADEIHQVRFGGLGRAPHVRDLGCEPIPRAALLLEQAPQAGQLIAQREPFRLALRDLRLNAAVLLLEGCPCGLQLARLATEALDLAAQVLEVVFHPVDGALDLELARLLLADRLVLLPARELDLLDRSIQRLQLGGVLEVRVPQLQQQRLGFVDLPRELRDVVLRQPDVQRLGAGLVFVEESGLGRLALEAAHLALDLEDDVGDPQQVLVRRVDLAQRLGLVLLIARDPGGFLHEITPLFRAGLGDDADVPLLDHRVGTGAQPAAEEKVVNVLETAGLLVQQVGAFARAVEAPGDVDFGEVAQLLGCAAVVVRQRERDLRHPQGRLAVGTGEDHVFHRLPAQLLDALLPHHPTDGVDDVALAAAVGAHDGGDPGGEVDDGLVQERFEAGDFEFLELHIRGSPPCADPAAGAARSGAADHSLTDSLMMRHDTRARERCKAKTQ